MLDNYFNSEICLESGIQLCASFWVRLVNDVDGGMLEHCTLMHYCSGTALYWLWSAGILSSFHSHGCGALVSARSFLTAGILSSLYYFRDFARKIVSYLFKLLLVVLGVWLL